MAEAPDRLRAQQFALTRHLRDPQASPAPEGFEDRRLAIYRELLFNNIEGLLSGNFPVICKLLGEDAWKALVRDFYRDHRCHTPLFPEIAREFLRYLELRSEGGRAQGNQAGDPPFLQELAHYEWVELALQIAEVDDDTGADPDGSLLDGAPALSPLAWPLAYAWPVHRIGPEFQPDQPPAAPTLLLLRRDDDGTVRFSELSPLAFRLVQRLGESPQLDGRQHLQALAAEAGSSDIVAFVEQGAALLEQMRGNGVVLGVRRANPSA
ncbi:putative DNA-binding domain-containing protein [Lysobacter sp. S4-A87]|uniref:HvfC family RiPP maturation protein n=1 Tax=Lysobacter sp. S4-A87 TaxID=2925843 RepID=UPI001F531B40|nr:putative DNA-binding domain-containing protein [Lysobacter sp. S4-A87]UNK49434.1 putative DNA-binding domain-containing protein [Lysobacter sp. S4-A87]